MKTGSISLITLCGALAGFSPNVLAGQTAETQTAGAASVTIRAKSADLSPGLTEVVKLQEAGVNESVVLTFVQNSPVAYRPTAEEIIKLHELGISSPIITAVLRRGSEVRQQHAAQAQKEVESAAVTATTYQPAAPAVSTAPSAPVYYAPPVTSPTVVYPSYPAYSYVTAAPYYYGGYSYPSYYYYGGFYPPISFGVRFGGGHFGGGHFGGGHFGGGHFGGGQFAGGHFGGGQFGGGHFAGGHFGGGHFVGHSGGFGHRH